MKIVIAEDDERFSAILCELLKGIASKIILAKSWREVEEYLKFAPNVLWSDLQLIDSDPHETYYKLAAVRQANQDIVIIVMSGYISDEMERNAKRIGIDVIGTKGRDSTPRQIMAMMLMAISNAMVRSPGNKQVDILAKAVELIKSGLPKPQTA